MSGCILRAHISPDTGAGQAGLSGKSMMTFATWLLIGVATLLATCSHTVPVASQIEHADSVFDDLARRDIANGILIDVLAELADSTAISEKLQLHEHLASPLTPSEQAKVKHSMIDAIKYILVNLAPKGFWERHLAAHYAFALSPAEAQKIMDAYDELGDRPEGRKLNAVRESFCKVNFQTLCQRYAPGRKPLAFRARR